MVFVCQRDSKERIIAQEETKKKEMNKIHIVVYQSRQNSHKIALTYITTAHSEWKRNEKICAH